MKAWSFTCNVWLVTSSVACRAIYLAFYSASVADSSAFCFSCIAVFPTSSEAPIAVSLTLRAFCSTPCAAVSAVYFTFIAFSYKLCATSMAFVFASSIFTSTWDAAYKAIFCIFSMMSFRAYLKRISSYWVSSMSSGSTTPSSICSIPSLLPSMASRMLPTTYCACGAIASVYALIASVSSSTVLVTSCWPFNASWTTSLT